MPERRKTRAGRTAGDPGHQDAGYEDERGPERTARAERSEMLSAADAASAGMRQIAELTGKDPGAVVSVEPADNGWLVGVEVVEDRRIPSTSDVLGLYEVAIDMAGDLVSYRRTKRYARGRGNGNGNGAA